MKGPVQRRDSILIPVGFNDSIQIDLAVAKRAASITIHF